jgi:DNA polymerase I
MKQLFGYYKMIKNGNVGKVLNYPEIVEMHTNPLYVKDWIEYSSFDAEITFFLRETLRAKLLKLPVDVEDLENNYNLYLKYWRPFGEVLTEMERTGFKVDLEYLKQIEIQAENDKKDYEKKFLEWVWKNQDDAKEFNPSSTQQMQHLLFAPYYKKGVDESNTNYEELEAEGLFFPRVRTFRSENL